MPTASTKPTPSRRQLLAGTAATAAAGATATVATRHPVEGPDAYLIHLCNIFDGYERKMHALADKGLREPELERRTLALMARQRDLVRPIICTPAKTLAGLKARAATLTLTDAVDPHPVEDVDLMFAALVRDIHTVATTA